MPAELLNAADRSQIWGHQYNESMTNVAALQQEIVRDKLSGAQKERPLHVSYGVFLIPFGRFSEALEEAYVVLAHIYQYQGKNEKAVETWEQFSARLGQTEYAAEAKQVFATGGMKGFLRKWIELQHDPAIWGPPRSWARAASPGWSLEKLSKPALEAVRATSAARNLYVRFLASTDSSGLGTGNCARPQPKHTTTLGNTHTMGSFRPSNPGKCIATSPSNVLSLFESQALQVIGVGPQCQARIAHLNLRNAGIVAPQGVDLDNPEQLKYSID